MHMYTHKIRLDEVVWLLHPKAEVPLKGTETILSEQLHNGNEPCHEFSLVLCVSVYMSTCLFRLCLKGGGQHLWEEFEEYRKKELHEGNNDEHHEGHQTEQISTGPHQLEMQRKPIPLEHKTGIDMILISNWLLYSCVTCKLQNTCTETLPVWF